jgi:hypothetical protein
MMEYKGYCVRITPREVLRENIAILSEGFLIEIYDGENLVDCFTAAVGVEVLENSVQEAEQLAKDYIDCEKKNICWRR